MGATFGMLGMFTIFIALIILVIKAIRKRPKKNTCIALFIGVVLFIVGMIIPSEPTSNTSSSGDMSIIIGCTVEEANEKAGIKLEQVESDFLGNYTGHYNTDGGEIVAKTDAEGKIAYIVIFGDKYSLYGAKNTHSKEEEKEILEAAGFTQIEEGVYRFGDTFDGITTTGQITYEKNSLEEVVNKHKVLDGYEPKLPNTVGVLYLGKGQVLEYAHDSIAELMYNYEKFTSQQKEEIAKQYDGSYVQVFGEVTDVMDGKVIAFCTDEEAAEKEGKLLPMMNSVEVELVPEQSDLLLSLKKGDKVTMLAQLNMFYEGWLGDIQRSCRNGIVWAVNGNKCDIPVIESVTSGIYTPLSENTEAPSSEVEKETGNAEQNDLSVNSVNEAIEAVKRYGEIQGWSDPYDKYEATEYAGYYEVYAGHSYHGDNWYEYKDIFYVDALNKNNVSSNFEELGL